MVLLLTCALVLFKLLQRVVVTLPIDPTPSGVVFIVSLSLNEFLCGIKYLVVDLVHVFIGKVIDWGYLVCFGLLVCTSCLILPLILLFHACHGSCMLCLFYCVSNGFYHLILYNVFMTWMFQDKSVSADTNRSP
jgi:hypothetical protein